MLNLTGGLIQIKSASMEDSGTYVCLGGYDKLNITHISLSFSVLLVGGNFSCYIAILYILRFLSLASE